MKGVILHGGSGTRLRPLTYTDVKQLLPVAGKPVSEYALLNLIELGIKDVNIIVGDVGQNEVREYYSDGSKWNAKISYTFQEKPLGIAHAIGLVRDFVDDDDFVVVLGDNYFQNGLMSLNERFAESQVDALVALTRVENPSQFGIATVSEGRIIQLEEKPKNPKSNLAVTGAYFLRKSIFPIIKQLKPSWRNELEITEALQMMLNNGMKLGYALIEGWWKDTGTVEEFLDCNRMVLEKIEDANSKPLSRGIFQGKMSLGDNVQIIGNTRILGPCYIGPNTRLENSYVGPYTSIGSNCMLKNVEVGNSVIMDACNLDVSDTIHIADSLIGPNTKIISSKSKPKAFKLVLGRDSKIEL
ncbi:MAG: glucose-1-phosphate thymidylyltransferase [Thermoplasmatales archaeon]|nr:glucose-1-phosphate thymidylyltransferase [Thermoplasmatales archaeon]